MLSAYESGYEAFYEGIAKDANPNEPGSYEYEEWDIGWKEAEDASFEVLYTVNREWEVSSVVV